MAILAAAVGDPIVEAIASTGTFGPQYYDADRSSVVPAVVAGLMLAAGAFVLRCLREWQNAPHRTGRRLPYAIPESRWSPLLQSAIVFGFGLLIVLGMQTSEQLLADGRVVDLHAGLGGPAWFALLSYGAISFALTTALRRFMQSFVTKVVESLREAQQMLRSQTLEDACRLAARSVSARLCGALDPAVRRTRGRAPPLELEPA
jgi:hypothetical protein